MMVFTDNDLAEWKKYSSTGFDFPMTINSERMQALLARLEAAEDLVGDDHLADCLWEQGRPCDCGYDEKLMKWRKSAGKDPS